MMLLVHPPTWTGVDAPYRLAVAHPDDGGKVGEHRAFCKGAKDDERRDLEIA